jgi:hypothetical protein
VGESVEQLQAKDVFTSPKCLRQSKFLCGEERMEREGFGVCSGGARPMEADSGSVGMIA